jgi:hypothetical protein
MNLISVIFVNLWVAGWVIAMVRAGLKARVPAVAVHWRPGGVLKDS